MMLDKIDIPECFILCWLIDNFAPDNSCEKWNIFFTSFLLNILNLSEKVSHITYIDFKAKMEREAGFEPAPRLGKVGLFSIELFPLNYILKGK